jgi:hypothetical protein
MPPTRNYLLYCEELNVFLGKGFEINQLGIQKTIRIHNQCCGSGSGILCLFDHWTRIRDEQPGSYFREETILWVKILKFFDADPGCKKFGSGIHDPGWDAKNSDQG